MEIKFEEILQVILNQIQARQEVAVKLEEALKRIRALESQLQEREPAGGARKNK